MTRSGSLLLGIDIGTASSKGVLCTPEGDVLASATIAHETSFPRPGWAEHDADTIWWGEFVQLCRVLLSGRYGPADVGAVAVSAIGPCMLPVDAAGRPLRPGILYGIDRRATAEIDLLHERCGRDAILALGGAFLTTQAVGPKIRWLRDHEPEVFAQTAMIQSSQGYVVFRLTGEHRVDRHTASYYTPLFDLETMQWSGRFADEVIGLDRLPPIVESTDVVGTVTAAASAETGLCVGTPVAMGTMDAVAEALSAGVTRPGEMLVMYGSTLFLVNLAEAPHIDPRIWNTAYCLPGRVAITGGLATSGLLTSWFRDLVRGDAAGEVADYATLAARAQAVPAGCDGLVCLPYFAGERNPLHDPEARGVFAGLTLAHTQGHLYRALLESVGYGFRGDRRRAPARARRWGRGAEPRLGPDAQRHRGHDPGDPGADDWRLLRRCVPRRAGDRRRAAARGDGGHLGAHRPHRGAGYARPRGMTCMPSPAWQASAGPESDLRDAQPQPGCWAHPGCGGWLRDVGAAQPPAGWAWACSSSVRRETLAAEGEDSSNS